MTTVIAILARDEEADLPRCLDSAAALVDDVLVIDTGSTDDTIAVARGRGADVLERPWVNFAHNRTELLAEASRRCDRILMLDADMSVDEGGTLPDGDADCYMATLGFGRLRYRLPFLVAAGKPWRYKGSTHSYLACDEPIVREDTDTFTVTHFGAGSGRDKLERDRDLLSPEANPRSIFYLAQTYRDLGEYDKAISLYMARAALGGWQEEVFYSLYQAGALLCAHRSFAQGAPLLIEAWKLRPGRAEPLRALGYSAHGVADKLPLSTDSLFVNTAAYKVTTPGQHERKWAMVKRAQELPE